jgi:Zyg-11 protein homolog
MSLNRNHRTRLKETLFLDGDKPSLLETVFKYLATNLKLISQLNTATNTWELRDDVIIPNVICDR